MGIIAMPQSIIQVDAFTNKPFGGNPAAVCIMDAPADETWMQNVAMELNLSETAFLHPENGGYRLRWFTPAAEVELCGHATLAAAHVLWETGALPPGEEARFHTLSGLLTARLENGRIFMDFPATVAAECEIPDHLEAAIGSHPIWVGRSKFDYLVVIDSEDELRRLKINRAAMEEIETRGTIVTARGVDYDFVSRAFFPRMNIDEDPVTGSAHCTLTPYWCEVLGKDEMLAYQASARGGEVLVRQAGDRVILGGQAVTVMVGELR